MVFEEIVTVLAALLIITRFPGIFWPVQTKMWIDRHLVRAKHETVIVIGLMMLVLAVWMGFLITPFFTWAQMFSAWIFLTATFLGMTMLFIPDIPRAFLRGWTKQHDEAFRWMCIVTVVIAVLLLMSVY